MSYAYECYYNNLTNTTKRNQNAGYLLYQHIYNGFINAGYLLTGSILTVSLSWKIVIQTLTLE